jgi:hypothetical protein
MPDRCKRLRVDIIGPFIGTTYIQAPVVNYIVVEIHLFPSLYSPRMKYFFFLKQLVKTRLAGGVDAKEDLFSCVMDMEDLETGTKYKLSKL